MKQRGRLLGLVALLSMITLLAACGSGRADARYAGKYVATSGEMLGAALQMADLEDYGLELEEGGRGSLLFGGTSYSLRWTNDDERLTIQCDGMTMDARIAEDKLIFDDLFGIGTKLTLAMKGSEAARPENNLPADARAMVGTWKSTAVKNAHDEQVSGAPADALVLTFTADYQVKISLMGQDYGTFSWSLLGKWGSIDTDGNAALHLTWDILDDMINVTCTAGNNYYTFPCVKQ